MLNDEYDKAIDVWTNRSNGSCDGISSAKGGRAWLDGEFQLCELEALCILIRYEADNNVEGFKEIVERKKGL